MVKDEKKPLERESLLLFLRKTLKTLIADQAQAGAWNLQEPIHPFGNVTIAEAFGQKCADCDQRHGDGIADDRTQPVFDQFPWKIAQAETAESGAEQDH